MQITIYTKPHCQPCRATKRKFDQLGIPYVEASAPDNVEYLASLGYMAAPVVEVDLGDGATAHWSDYRPTNIEQLYATLADKSVAGKVAVPERQ